MTSTVASSLKLTSSSTSLGRGRIDITSLLKGEEGHAVLDVWIELSTRGKVHLIIEYEPNGEDPQVDKACCKGKALFIYHPASD